MVKASKEFHLGDTLHVHGKGIRWEGMTYTGVVMDVRDSDNTVKLKYADGGYKRYPADELVDMLTGEAAYTLEAYEVNSEDTYDSTTEMIDELATLKQAISEAVKRADFEKAQELHDKVGQIITTTEDIQRLKHELVYSVQKSLQGSGCHPEANHGLAIWNQCADEAGGYHRFW